jgi:formylglycine-generating enzyme required for sulfatase activity/tRNA A-37 threonylcarbamoyl transferase component Bud32
MLDLVGQRLGQYRIEARVARGATSTIYKAYQEKLDRYVAVKVLSPHFVDEPGFLDRFYQEARAVARLDHPNILPVYDFDQVGEIVYIVMKYVDTGTLRHVITGSLDLAYTLEIATQVGLALGYAHKQGVVHRDVKPGNILIADNNWALLTDFGLAKMLEGDQRLTRTGTGVGTPEYMSPEQAQGKPTDGRSDLYSLGVMLYEMLTGHLPFESESGIAVAMKHVNDPVPPPCDYRPDLPPAVEQVILTALEKDPDRRFPTAEAMVTALTRAAAPALPPAEIEQSLTAARSAPIGAPPPEKSAPRLALAAAWIALRRQANRAMTRLPTWRREQRDRFEVFQRDRWPHYRAAIFARRRTLGAVAGVLLVVLICAALTPAIFRGAPPAATATMTPANKAALAAATVPIKPALTSTSAPTARPSITAAATVTATTEITAAPPGMALIPAGTFTMGAVSGEFDADETPPHQVYLGDYYIDTVEVTNAQFARFVNSSGYQTDAEKAGDSTTWRSFNSADRQRFPVIFVSWNDAARYCAWAGKRLPTEAEWEKAARGATKRIFPWGDSFNDNYANTVAAGVGQPVAVASRSARSPFGLYDTVGNVWEHVQDWYEGGYYTDSPKTNPRGPAAGTFKVIRGGSFKTQPARATTTARERISPDSRGDDIGFRCARNVS